VQGEINPGSSKISLQALDRGILSYCEQISIETYGDEVVRDVQKVGVELFTINYLSSSIFKMSHENTSRNKVTHWSDLGMLVQIGSVNIEGIRRPLNFYYIVDPALTRLITRSIDLKTFIKDRLVPCSSCNADNIMNVELFPKGNDPVCYKCNRNLF
jgi:hypothetical protein